MLALLPARPEPVGPATEVPAELLARPELVPMAEPRVGVDLILIGTRGSRRREPLRIRRHRRTETLGREEGAALIVTCQCAGGM